MVVLVPKLHYTLQGDPNQVEEGVVIHCKVILKAILKH